MSGSRTASGKPLLAGDPHIRFAAPAVWYEAQLSYPGFELYGHHQALNPVASLGHNSDFGWSITMFQNDDLDLIAEKLNPDNPNQVWYRGQWVELQSRAEQIEVKGGEPVSLTLRRSPHGPIINDALGATAGKTPIAMWWAFLETENPILDAFYQLNRADSLSKARAAAEKIQAPGLNVVWANTNGDIGWWAAAQLPLRPVGVNPDRMPCIVVAAFVTHFFPFAALIQVIGIILKIGWQVLHGLALDLGAGRRVRSRGRKPPGSSPRRQRRRRRRLPRRSGASSFGN